MGRTIKIIVFLILTSIAQSAVADKFFYRVNNPVEQVNFYSAQAGKIVYIDSSFDDVTNIFKFEVVFEPSPGTNGYPAGQIPSGFWLAMDDGPNPKLGHLAQMYFDATNIASPKITLYGYNNRGDDSSWQCGQYNGGETPCFAPDRILSNVGNRHEWVRNLYVEDLIGLWGQNQRRFYMDLDVSEVMNHTPLYGNPADWFGIGFKHQVGVWFHPIPKGLETAYSYIYTFPANESLRRGQFLTYWSTQKCEVPPGYYDTAYEIATDCAGNPRYKIDQNGNGYPVPPIVKEDICGVCGGDGSTCATPTPTPTATPTPPPVGCDGIPGSGTTIDKCGICGGNGDCTANCDRINITGELLALDGSGVNLLTTVKSSAKTLVKFGGKKQTKFARSTLVKAEAAQRSLWIAAWTYGTTVLNCPASANCDIRSFASNSATVTRGLKSMEALNRKLTAKLARLGSSTAKKKAKTLTKKGVSQLKKGITILRTLPSSSGVCYPHTRG